MGLKKIKEGVKDLVRPERIVERAAGAFIQDLEEMKKELELGQGPPALHSFFAVTTTSLYVVVARGEDGDPFIRKMDMRAESKLPVNYVMRGDMLAVAKWLQFYIPEGHGALSPMTSVERRLEMVNTQWWQGKTSAIIALFLTEEKARECFASSNLKPCDPRWRENTRKVLEVIGENHPTITICHWRDMALMTA